MLGKVIGTYKLMAEIGRGPYGVVYRALDQGRNREVALKAFQFTAPEQLAINERIRSLAPTIAQFRHPQLAEFYTTLQYGNERYLVTELIEGQSLGALLRQAGVLSADEAGKLLAQICAPLAWLYRAGWAHGDLKPSNVLVMPDGTVKLTDLGLAYALADQMIFTTPAGLAYRAPEQLRQMGFDARSDVYALGVMLYELVTGLLPFRRLNDSALLQAHLNEDVPSPRNYFPLIPVPLESIILRALAKQPEERFASPLELQNALLAWLELPLATPQPQTSHKVLANFSVNTQRSYEEPVALEPESPMPHSVNDRQEALQPEDHGSAKTIPEFPDFPLPLVPDTAEFGTAEFGDAAPKRLTKPLKPAAANVETAQASLPKVTAAGTVKRATNELPVPNSPFYEEVVVDLDDASTRKRAGWKPWLAVAGLAALVGVPYAMMQRQSETVLEPTPRTTPTVLPSPSASVAAIAKAENKPANRTESATTPSALSVKKAPTPMPTAVRVKPTPVPAPPKLATPAPTPRYVPAPTPSAKPAKKATPYPTPIPQPTPKEKDKKKGGLGGFFKDILTVGKEKEKGKKAEPGATPKKKY